MGFWEDFTGGLGDAAGGLGAAFGGLGITAGAGLLEQAGKSLFNMGGDTNAQSLDYARDSMRNYFDEQTRAAGNNMWSKSGLQGKEAVNRRAGIALDSQRPDSSSMYNYIKTMGRGDQIANDARESAQGARQVYGQALGNQARQATGAAQLTNAPLAALSKIGGLVGSAGADSAIGMNQKAMENMSQALGGTVNAQLGAGAMLDNSRRTNFATQVEPYLANPGDTGGAGAANLGGTALNIGSQNLLGDGPFGGLGATGGYIGADIAATGLKKVQERQRTQPTKNDALGIDNTSGGGGGGGRGMDFSMLGTPGNPNSLGFVGGLPQPMFGGGGNPLFSQWNPYQYGSGANYNNRPY